MKKLLFAFAMLIAVSFASCGGNSTSSTDVNDSTQVDTVVVDSLDSVTVDTVVA